MNPIHIHIIGIGGTGMNGIAQLAALAGYRVTGSDRDSTPPIFQSLKNTGIAIFPQDGSGISERTDWVVYSTAIEPDNPDMLKARALNIPLLHRADMLARLCEGQEVIAVAGTAGKSTVTGLIGWIFECLGKDPSVYCGAPVLNWKNNVAEASSLCNQRQGCRCHTVGNVRFGSGPWIIEADESDRSFLKFHPRHAVITNIAEDHFALDELHLLFKQFESQVSGVVIHGGRDGCETVPQASSPALTGKHNQQNIRTALTLCQALGLDMPPCVQAVQSFRGIERRLERHGPNVIDDFAHSPIKIAAALEAVSGEFPAFSAYWRPHGYTPLFQGLEAFTDCFSSFSRAHPACRFFILPVYFAGGTVTVKVTSEQFVERLQDRGVPAEFVSDYRMLEERLLAAGLPILGMGARDPELPRFAKKIAAVIG